MGRAVVVSRSGVYVLGEGENVRAERWRCGRRWFCYYVGGGLTDRPGLNSGLPSGMPMTTNHRISKVVCVGLAGALPCLCLSLC